MSDRRCQLPLGNSPPFERCPGERHAEGPYCIEHGCARCGHAILADTEDWPEPLCAKHYDELQP